MANIIIYIVITNDNLPSPPMNDDELFRAIGKNIRRIRLSKSMSQQDLAAILNIEKSNMSRIEYGRTNITVRSLYRISRALDVSMKELVDTEQGSQGGDG